MPKQEHLISLCDATDSVALMALSSIGQIEKKGLTGYYFEIYLFGVKPILYVISVGLHICLTACIEALIKKKDVQL